jgi:glutathione reductase (NADPH)
MKGEYDLIVIGTGTGGYLSAHGCRRAGWQVAIIDERPYGGTCALRGCDPKKVLTGAAEVVDRSRGLAGSGLAGGVFIDWPALIRYKRTFTEGVSESRQQEFTKAGIDTFHGPARFTGPDRLEVNGETLRGRHFVIATGAAPADLGIEGQEHVITSEQFLDAKELPSSVLFIGGGFISFEFAWASAAAGAGATILHLDDRPLARFDQGLVAMLVAGAAERDIDIRLEMPVRAVELQGDRLLVRAGEKGEHEFAADLVVHGGGRVPKIADLNLEAAGIRYGKNGVLVNEYLQSISHPAVYAAGDAAAVGPMLTPVAAMHGRLAAKNLLEGNVVKADHSVIPSVVFTHPPLAKVGLLQEEAERQGLDFEIHAGDASSWYSARRIGLRKAGYKMLIEKESRRILGAHLLMPAAGETINVLALAMRTGVTAAELKKTVWSYPSSVSDLDYML